MPTSAPEIALPLRHAVATCQILFGGTFEEIERKIGLKAGSSARLMRRAIDRAGCNDFHEVLACMNSIDRSGRPTRVVYGTELSAKIQNAMLIDNDLQSHVAVLDKENIDIPGKNQKKKPVQIANWESPASA